MTPSRETILVGRDISQIRDLRRRILLILLVSGGASVLAIALAAIVLSLKPLGRVRDLQVAASEIAAGKFNIRMPIAGVHDELDQFAETVNVMVDEVVRVIAEVKGVTDAIAHDLRTPLTRVRTRLVRAGEAEPASSPFAGLADDVVTDLDVVLARFTALLRISEIEASRRQSGIGAVNLSSLAANARDLYEPLAEERSLELTVDAPAAVVVQADEQLLLEAISNLVDNAIKFARSAVVIRVASTPDGAALEVHDDGPGIPADERELVLHRFNRGAHAAGRPGSGVGLSLVVAILHLHGFGLELENGAPGLVARIRIFSAQIAEVKKI
jgi:signal transduction histidine kinase